MANIKKNFLLRIIHICIILLCSVIFTNITVYADDNGNWLTKDISTLPGIDINSQDVVVVNDKIYFLGSSNVIEYNPVDGTFCKKKPIPEHKANHSAVVLDNKIYVIGGSSTNSLYVYDPEKDTWTGKPNMPSASFYHSAVVFNSKIYVSGGSPSSTFLMVYDPQTNTWAKESDTPYPIYLNSSVVFNNKIYIFGGLTPSKNVISKACVYDPIKKTWKILSNPPVLEFRNSAVVFNGKIHIVDKNNIFVEYNEKTDTWLKKDVFPKKNTNILTMKSVVFQNKIHSFTLTNHSFTLDIYEEHNSEDEHILTIDKTSLDLKIGQTNILMAKVTPQLTPNPKIIWSSSDSSIVSISVDGDCYVTGEKEGTAIITAKTEDDKLIATCTVNVRGEDDVPISKNRAILRVALTNGSINEYDLSMAEVQNFINWYNGRAEGKGKISFAINKNANIKPFKTRTDYLVFDKIYCFEVNEYELNNNEK